MRRITLVLWALRPAVEGAIIAAAFYGARDLRRVTDMIPWKELPPQDITDEKLLFFAITGALMWLCVSALRGNYSIHASDHKSLRIWALLRTSFWWFFVYIWAVFLSAGFLYTTDIPRLIIVFATVISVLSILLARAGMMLVAYLLAQRGLLPERPLLIIGDVRQEVIDSLVSERYTEPLSLLPEEAHEKMHTQMCELLIGRGITRSDLTALLATSRITDTYTFITSDAYELPRTPTALFFARDETLLAISRIPLTPWWRVLKRGCDIFLSCLLLAILLIPGCLIALLICVSSPGNPFYVSERVGRRGRLFSLYKFRSMHIGADSQKQQLIEKNERSGPLFKIHDDPRITPIGKFLRKYHIDEFPQLINVIQGNMSLVGPRPHLPSEVREYDRESTSVLALRPGITGMAQVHGRHMNSFEREIELDTWYLENWSVALDFSLLLRTILTVLSGKGS